MSGGAVSNNTSSPDYGGGVYVAGNGAAFTMSGGVVSGNTASADWGGGVYVINGTFTMNGGAVSDNTATGGGGVLFQSGTFIMSGGAVSDNTTTGEGGGVWLRGGGTFSMSGGVISGNTAASFGGGVYITGVTFSMSGGAVSSNILSSANGRGREVMLEEAIFRMSGDAWPEQVFLNDNARSITISGPLSGGITTAIDLGVTTSGPPTVWETAPVLKLDTSYTEGDLSSLKTHFTLGNSKMTGSPYTETAITGYEINDAGLFVHQ
jgi:hypothetical protein